ncbi:MAG: hypothetical protein KJ629_04000, partial [Candidatus Omnitrophica bacterium]|nr:hypothetical protein [Candidatus Omnitrophota bacterium]
NWFYTANIDDFKKIPGSPVAYWVSDKVRDLYSTCQLLEDVAEPKQGMATTDNDRYLRFWWELDYSKIGFNLRSMKEAVKSTTPQQATGYRMFIPDNFFAASCGE